MAIEKPINKEQIEFIHKLAKELGEPVPKGLDSWTGHQAALYISSNMTLFNRMKQKISKRAFTK